MDTIAIEEKIREVSPDAEVIGFSPCKNYRAKRLSGYDSGSISIGKSALVITNKGLFPVEGKALNSFKIHTPLEPTKVKRMGSSGTKLSLEDDRFRYDISFASTESMIQIRRIINRNEDLQPIKFSLSKGHYMAIAAFSLFCILAAASNSGGEKTFNASDIPDQKETRRENAKPREKEHTLFDAYYFACQEVKTKLKSPSSAKFSDFKESFVTKLDKHDQFTVLSHVEAQNSFGAMTKQMFNCQVNFMKDSAEVDCHIWNQ